MSDPINANPKVLDIHSLPTRSTAEPDSQKGQLLKSQISSLSLFLPHLDSSEPSSDISSVSSSASSLSLSSPAEKEEQEEEEDEEEEPIDEQEIFDLISTISDPEHPLTLAQLAVVNLADIAIEHAGSKSRISQVTIRITPTITHCSLATLIGLGIRVRLERSLPARFRIRILIKEGTHQSESQVNKQLNDKERVAAACENDQLLTVISQMLSSCK
ncbi:uncharacterized protein LODBEIA_P60220 [Lodderomyces beijingensis]|uniref:MIP18 family-like domain-containing protein n=1 Tax=Lodderomyces beijingensis TaxID=1775926 RepID=A0ABP0ZUI8_9ASCO